MVRKRGRRRFTTEFHGVRHGVIRERRRIKKSRWAWYWVVGRGEKNGEMVPGTTKISRKNYTRRDHAKARRSKGRGERLRGGEMCVLLGGGAW